MKTERQVFNDYYVPQKVTILNGVTAVGSAQTNPENYSKFTFHIISEAVTTGATILIQSSLDGTNWVDLSSDTIASNGAIEHQFTGKYTYLRANVSSYTDGTYSVLMIAGN